MMELVELTKENRPKNGIQFLGYNDGGKWFALCEFKENDNFPYNIEHRSIQVRITHFCYLPKKV